MSSVVIHVDNLSKQYRLGEVSTGSIAHDINRWWHRLRGNEDPYLKIGEENDRTQKGISDYVWALKNISFEVRQGEALGIIGRNGAGKSTLLKILSRTTTPTLGEVKIRGRVASLLEVGTGFHPELTGRDNIFLNGAILGMTKTEIKKKFDEIVDFAGVARYIDTPVKRYSSGMYVRLAFGVAAHLEPEILVVDEVLAVGDAEFQKKCLGKMEDVSKNEGRTILFVSHQMGTIAQLCNKAILLNKGMLVSLGPTSKIVEEYINGSQKGEGNIYHTGKEDRNIYFNKVYTLNSKDEIQEEFGFNESIAVAGEIKIKANPFGLKLGITLQNIHGYYIATSIFEIDNNRIKDEILSFKVSFPKDVIAPNTYYFRLALFSENAVYQVLENICRIKVIDTGTSLSRYEGINYGSVILNTVLTII